MIARFVLAIVALSVAACAAPLHQPQQTGLSGAVVSVHELAMLGKVTVSAGSKDGAIADATCPCAEYVVRLDSGGTVNIAQEAPERLPPIRPGDRVFVQGGPENQRVVAAPNV